MAWQKTSKVQIGQPEFGSESTQFRGHYADGHNIWLSFQQKSIIRRHSFTGKHLSECFLLLTEHFSFTPKQKSFLLKYHLYDDIAFNEGSPFLSFKIHTTRSILTLMTHVKADSGLLCDMSSTVAPSTAYHIRCLQRQRLQIAVLLSAVRSTARARKHHSHKTSAKHRGQLVLHFWGCCYVNNLGPIRPSNHFRKHPHLIKITEQVAI